MSKAENRQRFAEGRAPLGNSEETRVSKSIARVGKVGSNKSQKDDSSLTEALREALRRAAEFYPNDRTYPDDTWSYNGPDDY